MTSPSGRSRIVAKVGVDLPEHERLLRVPKGNVRAAVLGVWTAAVCVSRRREKDGFCALEWVESFATDETIGILVDVGLFERVTQDGVPGVLVLRYDEFNETKAQIDKRLSDDRNRQRARKDGTGAARSGAVPDGNRLETGRNDTGTTGTGNGNGSSEREPTGVALLAPDDIPITAEFTAKCQMAGARAPTRDDVARCLANAKAKGHVRADWESELFSWMLRSKSFERTRGAGRPDDGPSRSPSLRPMPLPPRRVAPTGSTSGQ